MKRKMAFSIAVILLLLCGAGIIVFIRNNQKTGRIDAKEYSEESRFALISEEMPSSAVSSDQIVVNESSDNKNIEPESSSLLRLRDDALLYNMNEEFLIQSRNYAQGETRTEDYGMYFGWHGDLCVTVKRALIYEDASNLEIKSGFLDAESGSRIVNAKVLVLDLQFNNISAAFQNGVKYEFDISMLSLKTEGDFSVDKEINADSLLFSDKTTGNIDYFDSAEVVDSFNDYYFQLPEGEAKEMRVGFYVNEDVLDNEKLVLKIGTDGKNCFGFRLNEIEAGNYE